MIEELISKVFADRNAAHLEHWASTSYSRHQALGDFYDEVIDQVDKVVEIYQGNFGRIPKAKLGPTPSKSIEAVLTETVKWVEENMEEISQGVKALENTLQDLAGIYFRTIYKLENLK